MNIHELCRAGRSCDKKMSIRFWGDYKQNPDPGHWWKFTIKFRGLFKSDKHNRPNYHVYAFLNVAGHHT